MKKVAVVGLGNLLMGDDGIGARVVEELARKKSLPGNVVLVQAETAGIAILPHLDGAEAIILVDAVDFDGECGEVRVFPAGDIETERNVPFSMHEVGLKDLVALLRLTSSVVPRLLLIGIKPARIDEGVCLSPEALTGAAMASRIALEKIDEVSSS